MKKVGGKVFLKRNYYRKKPSRYELTRNSIPFPIFSAAPITPQVPQVLEIEPRRPLNPEPLNEQQINELFFGTPTRRGGKYTKKRKHLKKSRKSRKSRKH